MLPASTVRFRLSLSGSTRVHRLGLRVAMADLNEWRRGCIGLGWMTTTQIGHTQLFSLQAKLLRILTLPGLGEFQGRWGGRRQSTTTTPRAPAPTQITR